MAAPKAAGTAGGSTKHVAKTTGADPSAFSSELTPAQIAGLEALRVPFPAEAIGKRPTISCGGCKDSKDRVCSTHTKASCKDCGQYVTTAHKHLDYVGHAEATDRLLSVDLTWNWEPLARDDRGLPVLDVDGGMWIYLTVCGMTRMGYGDAVGKRAGTTATKEIIGDAIRNAGMRFGMALDLWAKTDLHAEPPHPAEPYVDAIRQERTWMSSEWLAGVRKEADEAGQLDFGMPRGGGKTLGDVIDAQLKFLEDAAQRYAEMRIKRDEERQAREAERTAATSQIAREHGVPRKEAAGQAPSAPAAPPSSGHRQEETPATEAWVRQVCVDKWMDPDALDQALKAGKVARVVTVPSRPEDPDGPTLAQAMQRQINDLRRAAAQRTGTVRAAQAADHHHEDWGASSERAG